ncbi:MAG: hypothetical protein WAW02_03545 [Sideroxyarcus sp.]
MKRILAIVLLYLFTSTPSFAALPYAGVQIDDNSAGVLVGYPLNKKYAIEAHYTKSNSRIEHAGVTVDTSSTGIGIVGIALFPMKLNDVMPYSLFVKGGYERTTSTESFSIPASITLILPYNDTITTHKNQVIFGGGAELDLAKNLTGRLGLDFLGNNRSIYLAAIFKF